MVNQIYILNFILFKQKYIKLFLTRGCHFFCKRCHFICTRCHFIFAHECITWSYSNGRECCNSSTSRILKRVFWNFRLNDRKQVFDKPEEIMRKTWCYPLKYSSVLQKVLFERTGRSHRLQKKFKIANCQDDLLNLANEFISQKISENPYKDLNMFIVALIRPDLEETLVVDPKLAELSSLVKNVFYGFNKSKMSDLLSYPQLSFILKKFLNISQLTEFIGEKYSYPHTTEILASQVSFLIERWDEVLATHDPDSVCDISSSPKIGF